MSSRPCWQMQGLAWSGLSKSLLVSLSLRRHQFNFFLRYSNDVKCSRQDMPAGERFAHFGVGGVRARSDKSGPCAFLYPMNRTRRVSIQPTKSSVSEFLSFAVRPDGAFHQWREDPPRELSIALVADERFGRVTGWIEASCQRPPWAGEQS